VQVVGVKGVGGIGERPRAYVTSQSDITNLSNKN